MTKFISVVIVLLLFLFVFTPDGIIKWVCRKSLKFKEMLNIGKLKIVTGITTLFMVVTHMYAWVNGGFIFDATFIYRGISTKVVSDKWLGPFVWILDAGVNEPWIAGLLATVLMIISVYCIVEVLDIKSGWSICLISGLCATNSAIICQQEYAGGNYTGEIALVFACVAAWIIRKLEGRFLIKTILAALAIAISVGVYGAYIGIVPSLLVIVVFLDIFNGASWEENWKNAFVYLFQFLMGMVLYYVILRVLLATTGGQLSSYMGEDNLSSVGGIANMVKSVPYAYIYLLKYYMTGASYLPQFISIIMTTIMVLGGVLSVYWCYTRRKLIQKKFLNILLLVEALLILPMAINFIYIAASGQMHFLMIFTYVVPMLLYVKIIESIRENHTLNLTIKSRWNRLPIVLCVFLCIYLYYHIIMANAVYVHYHNMYDVSVSLGTRLIDRIETCEGFYGDEQVVLLGRLQTNLYFGEPGKEEAEILNAFLGNGNPNNINVLKNGYLLKLFLTNILNSKIDYIYYDTLEEYVEYENQENVAIIEGMESFPRKDCVKKIDDRIYVKLSDL